MYCTYTSYVFTITCMLYDQRKLFKKKHFLLHVQNTDRYFGMNVTADKFGNINIILVKFPIVRNNIVVERYANEFKLHFS